MLRMILFALPLAAMVLTVLPIPSASASQDAFEPKKFDNGQGQSIPYRILRPEKIEPGQTYPFVLFLHGAGERGTDNAVQIKWMSEFATPENRRKYPCFFVAPQCPVDRRWVEVDWSLRSHTMPKNASASLATVKQLVDKLVMELPVDRSRVYVTGFSMGGYGTWDAIQRWPDYFAAAIPICGGGDVAEAPKLTKLPIWAFHGDKDSVVPVNRTTDMIEAIRKAGGNPKVTIYPGVDHDSWSATYTNPDVFAWLFAQKKK